MLTWAPRVARMSASLLASRSSPLSRIWPVTILPGRSISRTTLRLVMLLPQPDSPTTPSVWPYLISKLTPSTHLTMPSCVKKWVLRSLISRRFSDAAGFGAVGPGSADRVKSEESFQGGGWSERRTVPGCCAGSAVCLLARIERVAQAITQEARAEHDDYQRDARVPDPLGV